MEAEIHNLEQIAYGAVLRAFKAQSDALSWEKEGLITELRKELRVSDDEHRELLSEVNADDLIRRIREWRETGGNHNVAPGVSQLVSSQLPSPSVSGSRKRQKIPLPGNPFGVPSQTLHPQSGVATPQSLTSSGKWGPASGSGRRPNAGQAPFSLAKPTQYQFGDRNSEASLIGRRVMIKWPADNIFYEALITEYNALDGRHALVYDSNTPNATLEWVNIKEVPPEDIRWVGEDPVMSRLGEAGGLNSGRGRVMPVNQFTNDVLSQHDVIKVDDYEEIEILNTDILIKKVQNLLDKNPPDLLEISKAKKMLKEHEQTLMEVIKKLAIVTAAQGSENERSSSIHAGSQQLNAGYHGPSPEIQITETAGSDELPRG